MNIKKTMAGLGIGITLLSSGYVGTHERINGSWMTNDDYKELKTTLIEKQEKNDFITIQEYQLLILIYDKEAKRGIGKLELQEITNDNFISKLNNKFK